MTAPAQSRLSTGRAGNDLMRLVEAADRDQVSIRPGQFWPDYCINDLARPEARQIIVNAIGDGLLHVVDPDAPASLIKPTTKGLAKIGASR